MMRRSRVLAKIRAGQVARVCSVGGFLRYFPRLAAEFRYDGIWVDAERRAWDPSDIAAMLALHHLADIDCLWRPATVEKKSLYRLLEAFGNDFWAVHQHLAACASALDEVLS